MQLLVHQAHTGEGQYPTFARGEWVEQLQPCAEYDHWYGGVVRGYASYFPHTWLAWHSTTRATLKYDYNPTELDLAQGAVVTLLVVAHAWAWVRDEQGRTGWLPFAKLVSLEEDRRCT